MTLLTRFEFIGLQDGYTVTGHRYARGLDDVRVWLTDNGVIDPFIGYAGFIPEDFVLSHRIVTAISNIVGSRRFAELIAAFNELALSGDFEHLKQDTP